MISRPLLTITIAFAAGIALSSLMPLPSWIPVLCALFLLLSAGVVFIVFKKNSFPILVAVFAALGWAAAVPDGGAAGAMEYYLNKNVTLEGYICRDPDFRGNRTVYTLEVKTIFYGQQQAGAKGKVLLYVPGSGAGLGYGDVIRVSGRPYLPESPGNPGGFDYGKYLQDRNIWALLSVKDGTFISKTGEGGGHFLSGAALGIKQRLEEINLATMDQENAALINGMIFGGRGGIDPDTSEVFNESGVVHILSVSGLHVGLVMASVLAVLGLAGLSRVSFPVITGVLILYVFITGMGPAVVRAAIMAWVQLLGHHLGRDRDWPTTLAASALLILLFSPGALFEPGFQLSFTATWGILHLGPPLNRVFEKAGLKRPWLKGTLSVSLGAILGTMPLVAYHYNLLSLISIPANLVAVPLVGIIIPLGLLADLCGLLFVKAALVINFATTALLELMVFLVKALHQIPGGVVYIPTPRWVVIAVWYLSLMALPLLWNSRRKKAVRPALVCLLALFPAMAFIPAGMSGRGLLQVHVVDVGQGDSILIRFPGGGNMLVDAGGRQGEFEEGRGAGEVVASYLRRNGIRKIDVLVLTHPHEDHAAGALYLVGRFAIGTVLVPPLGSPDQSGEAPDPVYHRLLDSMGRRNIPVREVVCGDALSVDPGVSVDVLGPGAKPLSGTRSDLNNNSVVLSVRYGESSFLFTGDIELEGQARLLESGYALNHNVLKVPHHGSRYFSRDFLDSVSPGLAVISVGQNSFGQPHPDTMVMLEGGGRPVFRTDRDGLTVLFSDGKTIKSKIYKR